MGVQDASSQTSKVYRTTRNKKTMGAFSCMLHGKETIKRHFIKKTFHHNNAFITNQTLECFKEK